MTNIDRRRVVKFLQKAIFHSNRTKIIPQTFREFMKYQFDLTLCNTFIPVWGDISLSKSNYYFFIVAQIYLISPIGVNIARKLLFFYWMLHLKISFSMSHQNNFVRRRFDDHYILIFSFRQLCQHLRHLMNDDYVTVWAISNTPSYWGDNQWISVLALFSLASQKLLKTLTNVKNIRDVTNLIWIATTGQKSN